MFGLVNTKLVDFLLICSEFLNIRVEICVIYSAFSPMSLFLSLSIQTRAEMREGENPN